MEFRNTIIDYYWRTWSITDGQPIESVLASSPDTLDVVAGRKSSVEPAAAFTMGLAVTNLLGLNSPLSAAPKELNFAVFGEMNFYMPDGTHLLCPDFRIG